MIGEAPRPCPKPVKRVKERKGLAQVSARRAARIAAGEERPGMARSWMKKGQKTTAYSKRERLWGFMCFVRRTLPCVARTVDGSGPCVGGIQFMHLGPRAGYRKCHDSMGGAGCAGHHNQIDNPSGFYLEMADEQRADFRARVIAETWAAWDALGTEQQEWWDGEATRLRAESREAARGAA